jgi:hypothetical protein
MITLLRHQKFLLTLSVFDEGQGTQFALNSIFAFLLHIIYINREKETLHEMQIILR